MANLLTFSNSGGSQSAPVATSVASGDADAKAAEDSAASDDEIAAVIRGPVYGFSQDEAQLKINTSKLVPGRMDNEYDWDGATKSWATVMRDYAEMVSNDPDQFRALQSKLYAGGFYDSYLTASKGQLPKFGRMDADTIKALHDALSEAAATGNTVDDVLDNAALQTAANAAGAKPSRLTNPDVVRANAQTAAQSVVGQRLDDGTISQIQQNAEALAQQTYTDSNGVTQYYGGTPDQSWMQDQIRQLRPQTTAAFNTAGNVGQLLKLIDTQGVFSAYHQ